MRQPPLCEQHHHLVHEGGWTLTMTPDRVATWTRPDGVVAHHGSTIDRTPTAGIATRHTNTAPGTEAGTSTSPDHRGERGGEGQAGRTTPGSSP